MRACRMRSCRGRCSGPLAVMHCAEAVAAFDLPDEIGGTHRVELLDECKPAEELALQLCAHFTSAGQHVLALLYQDAYQVLASDD